VVEEPIAIDGKPLRGSKKQGAPGALLLSALAHRVGVTLAQQAVNDKPHEMPLVLALLRHRVLEGRMVTMDAFLTQRQIAQPIVAARGDDVMVVRSYAGLETRIKTGIDSRLGGETLCLSHSGYTSWRCSL